VGRIAAVAIVLSLASFALPAGTARAEAAGTDADFVPRLRAELWGGDTFTGRGRWLHDAYFVTAFEYEWSLFSHVSMGARGLPVLAYFDSQPIVGTALGLTNRVYLVGDGSGLFVGLAAALVVHDRRFEGNSSHFNLLSSFELGYQLSKLPPRLSVKLEHLSNAYTAKHNLGWNGVSLLLGWNFDLPDSSGLSRGRAR